ncbi:MAG: sulfur oxidation c-type cytochrome SoxX [Gammaproteobacteria bacterium]|nr:sulfur oxidation c-type cytochrome SoxX [Gammaproteobacteria bacterium]
MRKSAFKTITAISIASILTGLTMIPVSVASASEASVIAEGKKLAFNRKKGNCLACHAIAGGKLPGNIGPALIAMKDRYPDKSRLRAQIWDSTANNPNSMMPPFGRHKILSNSDIDKITAYIYSL